MPPIRDAEALRALSQAIHVLDGSPTDFEPLLHRARGCMVVLLGEASHGTHEFYRVRAEITKQLIRHHGVRAIAVEADWPDAWRVNRYIQGRGDDQDAEQALAGFRRFPQWMWRNADVLDLVGWLRAHNETVEPAGTRVGFYGLDLYSLHGSMAAVVEYLRQVDPEAAARAARRYACFDHFGGDPQEYGYATSLGLSPSCEREVLSQLVELRAAAADYARRDGRLAEDDLFFAERNAEVVATAERYYREMFRSHAGSWNLRDRHMAGTLEALVRFLSARAPGAGVVVWAHNSHQGDARATEQSRRGEVTLGQLTRERYGRAALLVGFTTWAGSVTAASDWECPVERKVVRPALTGSYENLFHQLGEGNFSLDLRDTSEAVQALRTPRLERAIGVIYRPETERLSHYFEARLPDQFDLVLHYDRSRAVEPLERTPLWEQGARELPETYPSTL